MLGTGTDIEELRRYTHDRFKLTANTFAGLPRRCVVGVCRDAYAAQVQLLHERGDHLAGARGIAVAAIVGFDAVTDMPEIIKSGALAYAEAHIANAAAGFPEKDIECVPFADTQAYTADVLAARNERQLVIAEHRPVEKGKNHSETAPQKMNQELYYSSIYTSEFQ